MNNPNKIRFVVRTDGIEECRKIFGCLEVKLDSQIRYCYKIALPQVTKMAFPN